MMTLNTSATGITSARAARPTEPMLFPSTKLSATSPHDSATAEISAGRNCLENIRLVK